MTDPNRTAQFTRPRCPPSSSSTSSIKHNIPLVCRRLTAPGRADGSIDLRRSYRTATHGTYPVQIRSCVGVYSVADDVVPFWDAQHTTRPGDPPPRNICLRSIFILLRSHCSHALSEYDDFVYSSNLLSKGMPHTRDPVNLCGVRRRTTV